MKKTPIIKCRLIIHHSKQRNRGLSAILCSRSVTWWEVFWTTTGKEKNQEDDQGKQARPRKPQALDDPRQDFTKHIPVFLLSYL